MRWIRSRAVLLGWTVACSATIARGSDDDDDWCGPPPAGSNGAGRMDPGGGAPAAGASGNPARGGVSGSGTTVVGTAWVDTDGTMTGGTAVGWSIDTGLVPLDLSLRSETAATAVSDDGSVIVGYDWASGPSLPFRWTPDAVDNLGWTELLHMVEPNDLSSDGTVVVGAMGPAGDRAFRWTAATGFGELDLLDGDATDAAYGVSGDGRIVVGSSAGAVAEAPDVTGSSARPVGWSSENAVEELVLPSGASEGYAVAANLDGTIAIGSASMSAGLNTALLWSNRGMEQLEPVSEGESCWANGTNADGTVVVGRSGDAMIWTRAEGARALREVLEDAGVNLSSWELYSAHGVSGDGKVVVGADFYGGRDQAWIAWLQ